MDRDARQHEPSTAAGCEHGVLAGNEVEARITVVRGLGKRQLRVEASNVNLGELHGGAS